MLLSYLVYISFAINLFALGWHVNSRENSRIHDNHNELPFYSWEIIASVSIITVIMGVRFKTGSDYMMYWTEYLQVGKGYNFSRNGGFESGYELITRLFASLKLHYTVYFGFWAFIQATLLYYGFRHHKFLLPWMGLLLVLGPYSINWFSFMRQWVVTCAFVPMVTLIYHKKLLLYILCILILSTIHLSAFLLILFYFLPYNKIACYQRKTYLIIFILMVLLGIKPFWVFIFKPLVSILPLLKYDRYADMFQYLMDGNNRILSWGALHIIAFFSQAIVLYYYDKIKNYRKDDKLLPFFFVISFIAICYDNLFINTIHFLLRPMELLYVFILIMLAYTYDYLYKNKRYWELVITLIPVSSYVLINVLKTYLNPTSPFREILNYHFFFLYSL